MPFFQTQINKLSIEKAIIAINNDSISATEYEYTFKHFQEDKHILMEIVKKDALFMFESFIPTHLKNDWDML